MSDINAPLRPGSCPPCGDPNCNIDREAKMLVIERSPAGVPTVWCDPCIAPIVRALNAGGVKTRASCCGHGRVRASVMLADGTHLEITPPRHPPILHAKLNRCDASKWTGDGVDLVLTNPYAPLPGCLRSVPMILTNFAERKAECEDYAGGKLEEVGTWANGRCRVWVRNIAPVALSLSDLVPDEFEPGRGWLPLELPLRLLKAFGRPGITVWDGFMGRGTVGKACWALGMNFIGCDILPERVALAEEYLKCR